MNKEEKKFNEIKQFRPMYSWFNDQNQCLNLKVCKAQRSVLIQ